MPILQKFNDGVPIKKENVIISIISLIIFIIGLQITPWLSPDSLRYIAVAEKIITEGTLYPIELHSSPLASYATLVSPPLFEYLISVFLLFGFEKLAAGGMVSLLFLALLTFPTYYLAKEVVNRKIGYLSVLCLISMASTWYVGMYVWTETTFTFLSLSALFFCVNYLKKDCNKNLLLCSIFCMLSCLTKWVGIILSISILSVLLYKRYKENRPSGVLLLLYSVISFLPVGALLLRNIIFKGNLYPNPGSKGQFSDIFIFPIKSILRDFLNPLDIINPDLALNYKFVNYLLILVLIISSGLVIKSAVKANYPSLKDRLLCKRKTFVLPVILYLVLYILGLMFLKSVSHFDDLDTRLLFPVYPLILIIFFYLYCTITSCLRESDKVKSKRCLLAFVVLFLVLQSNGTSCLLLNHKDGNGYSSPEVKSFTTSDSFIFLKDNWNKLDPIYTNVNFLAVKYYLDSYLNENIFVIDENLAQDSLDNLTILYIQTNKQDKEDQILKILANSNMFIRCIKDENYEVWIKKGREHDFKI